MKSLPAYFVALAAFFLPLESFAQQDPVAMESKTYEYIETEVERYTNALSLEDWQVFYVDSVLTANVFGMQAEAQRLQASGVSNTDIYQDVRDKWDEATYQAFRKFLDDKQWTKYGKMGATREKTAREKRAAAKKRQI